MKKYLVLYIIGFTLLIASSINIVFEVASFEYNVIPTPSELTTERIEYDVSNLIVDGLFYSYYKHEIDDTLEDNIVIIETKAIGDASFNIRTSTHYKYENNEHSVRSKSLWIESTAFRPLRYFESIITQIKEKKIYIDTFQLNRYQVRLYMNSNTAKKYLYYR